ncbi:MAG: ABC transporter permease [Oscillospiraceae bacterium]|jgi:putative ABC transport system permease protein|nr:ABC transporter permease [Oscillospiraceae bacterium]
MKSVFSKITLKSLKKNRVRTVVTIIGVILSIAMITAVTTFVSSLQNFLIRQEIKMTGDWQVKFLDVDYNFAKKTIANSQEIRTSSVIRNVGYAALDDKLSSGKAYLFVAGLDDASFKNMSVELIDGNYPKNENEVLISEHVSTHEGVLYKKIGDTLTLPLGSRIIDGKKVGQNTFSHGDADDNKKEIFSAETTKTYTVVGICKRPVFEDFSAAGATIITKTNFHMNERSSFDVFISLKSPRKVYDYAKKIAGNYDCKFNTDLLRFMGVSDSDKFNRVLYSFAGILIGLIMTGSILLIYNSFAISVSERSRQFGILSSVGATRKQLRKLVLFEGFYIGIIGIPLGVIFGITGIGITLKLIDNIINVANVGVNFSLSVSVFLLLITTAIGIFTIMISAYIPARRTFKKSAISVIKQVDDVKVKPKKLRTPKIISLLFGIEGNLALKNFKRNKKRYRTAIISLFVSLVLFISASSFGLYMSQLTKITLEDVGCDLLFSVQQYGNCDHIQDEQFLKLYDRMKSVDGVYKSAYQKSWNCFSFVDKNKFTARYLNYIRSGRDDGLDGETIKTYMRVYFIDDNSYQNYLKTLNLSPETYNVSQNKLPAVGNFIGYDHEENRRLSINTFNEHVVMLDLKSEQSDQEEFSRKISLDLVDTLPEGFSKSQINFLTIFAPYSEKKMFLNSAKETFADWSITFSSKIPRKSETEIKTIMKDVGRVGYSLHNIAEESKQTRNTTMIMNIFVYGFIILISLIAIANVFNTISTNVNLRTREFAMLRSVGLTNTSFNKMMSFECIFYAFKALLYGLPASIAIMYWFYKTVFSVGDISLIIPWGSIVTAVLSTFFLVFVIMMYSVNRAKKANIIDALKDETI